MVTNFSFPETRRIKLSNEPLRTTVAVVVFAWLANVTDGQTDRQTDGFAIAIDRTLL